jgi:hypothetical protein
MATAPEVILRGRFVFGLTLPGCDVIKWRQLDPSGTMIQKTM